MTVFADAFALIAWLNPHDDAHAVVTAYLDGFAGRLVTTEWVLMELADALSAPRRVRPQWLSSEPFERTHCLKSSAMTRPCTEPGLTCSPRGQTKVGP
jgi:hypothetical protein